MHRKQGFVFAAAALTALAACGDDAKDDGRGYTKAPLETPGFIVDTEERTAMDRLGDPVLIPMMDTVDVEGSPEPGSAAASGSPGSQDTAAGDAVGDTATAGDTTAVSR